MKNKKWKSMENWQAPEWSRRLSMPSFASELRADFRSVKGESRTSGPSRPQNDPSRLLLPSFVPEFRAESQNCRAMGPNAASRTVGKSTQTSTPFSLGLGSGSAPGVGSLGRRLLASAPRAPPPEACENEHSATAPLRHEVE